ncbi:MAG TPA: CpsB/CapC family capsule biosynthesis tyrosine phosphatase, partial [Puia sp.]|nr:CpsB/CapC family capsule biosynthesis tyrosine phosphatase [Puia sp.]
MFSFFKKKPRPGPKLESIGCDIHSHLIPGIDDGSPDMETSMLLIRGLVDLGYRKLITTPHVNSDHFRNTPEIILGGRDHVIAEIRRQGLEVEFAAAAEYLIDDGFMDKLARAAAFQPFQGDPLSSSTSQARQGDPLSLSTSGARQGDPPGESPARPATIPTILPL